MADTDNGQPSETVANETLKNDAPNTVETTRASAASKEDNQLIMRLAQEKKELEAKLAAKEQAEAATRQKQLEEKEEFKTLYEQTQAKLKEIEDAQAAQERQSELSKATEEVFKDYPENVVALAKTAGLSLADDSEAAQAVLKEKLDAFQKQVGSQATPRSNNPRQIAPTEVNRDELVKRDNRWEGSPMAQASAKGDESLLRQYISELPAIKRMREIAERGV